MQPQQAQQPMPLPTVAVKTGILRYALVPHLIYQMLQSEAYGWKAHQV